MAQLARLGVSLDGDLLKQFDRLISQRGYTNRSEAFRDLIRDELVEADWEAGTHETAGIVSLVYDHDSMELAQKLTEMQHDSFGAIISSLHVHLDKHNCLEVLVLKGRASDIRRLGERLISVRGVKHGKLTLATTGKHLG